MDSSGKPRSADAFRVLKPLGDEEDPAQTFCSGAHAQATTATRFFRNEEIFQSLRERVLPACFALRPKGAFSIWSAGCSSGEETYSLSMVLLGEMSRQRRRQPVRVFGTDINRDCLLTARRAAYRYFPGYAGSPYARLLNRYARIEGPVMRMRPELTGCTRFGPFDLRQRPRRHTFDFIVCNHVLQYYDRAGQIRILDNLKAVLRMGGFLYVEGITPAIAEAASLVREADFRNLYQPPPPPTFEKRADRTFT